jgi:predicted Rossmann fold flavoprotein
MAHPVSNRTCRTCDRHIRCGDFRRRGSSRVAGDRQRWAHRAKDRRDAFRISNRRAVRAFRCRPATRAGATRLRYATLARYGDLAGVSLDAEVSCNGARFRENLLFTHRGLSGPAILQISSYWDGREPIHIDLLPDRDGAAWLRAEHASSARLDTLLGQHLPKRFAQQWSEAQDATLPMSQLSDARLQALGRLLNDWPLLPSGTLGYNKAEVTLGGIDTRELSSKTMAANKVPGLFFVGEVVDVTGHLGGHNFQWAWASGHAAGLAA